MCIMACGVLLRHPAGDRRRRWSAKYHSRSSANGDSVSIQTASAFLAWKPLRFDITASTANLADAGKSAGGDPLQAFSATHRVVHQALHLTVSWRYRQALKRSLERRTLLKYVVLSAQASNNLRDVAAWYIRAYFEIRSSQALSPP